MSQAALRVNKLIGKNHIFHQHKNKNWITYSELVASHHHVIIMRQMHDSWSINQSTKNM